MKVNVTKLDARLGDTIPMPTYGSAGAAAIDLRAVIGDPVTIGAGESALIGTGLAFHIENKNYVGMIAPKFTLAKDDKIILGNSIGIINSDSTSELKVLLLNRGSASFTVHAGDEIAQFFIVPVQSVEMDLTSE